MRVTVMSRSVQAVAAVAAVAVVTALAGVGCVDIVGADIGKYVEREEKHFTTAGKPEISVATFDGSIEIRPWDKPEVQVVVEKHALDKADADDIEVRAEQNGNHVIVEVKSRRDDHGFHLGWNVSRSAKLIVSAPATSDVAARSGDGSIDVERISGRLELKSGDGSIRGRELGGAVTAHSGDGSVTLEVPEGFGAELDAHTGDGHVRLQDVTVSNVVGELRKNSVKGRLGSGGPALRVRTGDGSITLRRP